MNIQLSLRASKLRNVAGAFKGISDPFAVVSVLSDDSNGRPVILGKTEVVKNCLSPDWVKTFTMEYELGRPTRIAVSVYDEIKKSNNKSMGSAIFEVGAILGAKGNTKAKRFNNGGTIYVRVEKSVGIGNLRLKMSGVKLKNVEGMFGKSDPFFTLSKKDEGYLGTEWNVVYRSHVVHNNLNPHWKEDMIELKILCGDNLDQPILVSVYDYEKSGKHKTMGQFQTSVNGLIGAKNSEGFTVKTRKGSVGRIIVHVAETSGMRNLNKTVVAADPMHRAPNASLESVTPVPMPTEPTFLDYIHGGCEIQLCVAIDFTGSNGDPRKMGTLHYRAPDGSKNDYEKAISAIGGVLANYDTDQKFPGL